MGGRFVLQAKFISETKRVRYLLGLSSPAERAHIESEYFEDDDVFQEMLTAEDDLIDAYARGELEGEERRRFQKSFVSSLRGRDRVQFARAFAGAVSDTQRGETKLLTTFFKIFQSPGLIRIAAVIVFVALLAWLVSDHRRITNEVRELRAESAELSKRVEESNAERTRTAEIGAPPAQLRGQPDKPRRPERRTMATQQVRRLPEVANKREEFAVIKPEAVEQFSNRDNGTLGNTFERKTVTEGEKFETIKPEAVEQLINRDDATLGNTFERKQITELPLDARNVPSLLTLQPATSRGGYVAGARSDQANVRLDGVDVNTLNTYFLMRRNLSSSSETTIRIPSFLSWVRFQIGVETTSILEDYRVTIKTADGRPVTSVEWTEPLIPNQTIIDTPAISTSDLPSGDYVLLLMGKEPDGSFVIVTEYAFKVIKY